MVAHLQKLADIANTNDGNRAAGTPGYAASVDYVVETLRGRGFDVQTPEFAFEMYTVDGHSLKVGEREIASAPLTYSKATAPEGVTARIVPGPAGATPGCEATDYDGLDVTGAIVVIQRGDCTFTIKQQVAADKGAAAVIVFNNEDGPLNGTLGGGTSARVPTLGVSKTDGEALLAQGGEATMTIDAKTDSTTTKNIVAQTKTGSTENVVMVGSHLDSVSAGPGINDNGSGVAAILETALALGSEPNVTNTVRFAFWGAEELGLRGSTEYVTTLSDQEKLDLALYLNFDMIGSHNAGYLADDGDDSDKVGAGPGPEGSAGIERTFVQYLGGKSVAADGTDFDGRSDYGPFIEVGVPAGGVFSGADEKKTDAQAGKWGGTASENFDQNYHTAQDTLANVDQEALAKNSAAVAFAIGTYANSIDGPDGVPARADRERVRAPK